jgi:hypothetical protein
VSSTTKDGERFENYVSVAEAARVVGTTTQAMANLVRKGNFTTKMVAGRLLVLRAEVESFVPRPKGRPAKELQTKSKPLRKSREVLDGDTSGKYISQAEAARIRGVSKQAIANLINRGRLRSVSVVGRTLVLRSEVEAFVPHPVGHPLKKKTRTKVSKRKRTEK